MSKTMRRAIVVVGAVALATALPACSSGTTSPSSTARNSSAPVSLTYSAPVPGALPFLPVEIAIAENYFKDENIDVTEKQTSAAAMPTALTAGQIDMSADVVYNVARYWQSGLQVKFVAGLNSNVDFTLVEAKNTNLPAPTAGPDGWKATFAALKGKSIGTAAKAGPIGLTVTELMKEAGVPAGEYTLVDTPGAAAGNALAAGQVAAVLTGGGFDVPLIANGLGAKVLTLGADVPAFQNQSNAALFLSAKAVAANPTIGPRIQAAIAKAVTFIKDPANADAVHQIALKTGSPDTPQLVKAIEGYGYDASLSLSGLQAGFQWAQTAGITTSLINAKDTIAEGVDAQ
jgi:NitT/TauT family transport system substrate-binding protein